MVLPGKKISQILQCVIGLVFLSFLLGNTFTETENPAPTALACDRTSDSLALVALYDSTNGPEWTDPWVLQQPMDNWHGVTLDAEGCVLTLFIRENALTGSIPPEIGNLSKLKELYLDDNALTESIPPEIGNLGSLHTLSLGGNAFNGPIPPEIGNLDSLSNLDLRDNALNGQIPPEIGNLTSLLILTLSDNNLNGQIPPEIGNLSKLRSLFLNRNDLTGPIPPEIGNLDSLHILSLGGNAFNGPIPPEIGNLSNLEGLSLGDNSLTGPVTPEIGNLSNLESLSLNNNSFTGPIPPEIGDLTSLVSLTLSDNDLNGPIPPEIENLDSLSTFTLYGNHFTFNDLIPILNFTNDLPLYAYSPQASIDVDSVITATTGDLVTIDLGIDSNVGSNIYTWFKDFTPYDTIVGNNMLSFTSIGLDDAGFYRVEVTNPQLPLLTLSSPSINLVVNCDVINDTLTLTGCEGDSFSFFGQVITQSGVYRDTIFDVNPEGCDSIIVLDLTIKPHDRDTVIAEICDNETYNWINEDVNLEGLYRDTIPGGAPNGCDRILLLDLTVNPTVNTMVDTVICPGQLPPEPLVMGLTPEGCEVSTTYNVIELTDEADAGQDLTTCLRDLQLNASPPEDDGVAGRWEIVNNGNLTFIVNPEDPQSSVSELVAGQNQFVWILSHPQCPDFDSDVVSIYYENITLEAMDDQFIFDLTKGDLVTITGDVSLNDDYPPGLPIEILPTGEEVNGLELQSDGTFLYDSEAPASFRFTYRLAYDACPELIATANAEVNIIPVRGEDNVIITPNGDGMNDTFKVPELIDNMGKYKSPSLVVLNRWGQIVYNNPDYNNDWDIRHQNTKKLLPTGSYFYVLKLDEGEGKIRYGELLILR